MLIKYVVWHEERSSNQSLPSPTAEIAALFPSNLQRKNGRADSIPSLEFVLLLP